MPNLMQDIKYAVRMLVKKPGFTIVAVLTLALGIGANTAVFTVVNAVFLNPLPIEDGSRLVGLYTTDAKNAQPNFSLMTVSYRNYEDFRDQSDVFTGLADYVQPPLTLSGEGDPEQIPGMLVTANYFDVLGVKAYRGRTFLPEEDKTPTPLAVVSYSLWARKFGSDPNFIGRTLTLNSERYTVIGIAPPSFKGLAVLAPDDVIWIPMGMNQRVLTGFFGQFFLDRRALFTQIVGRLKPGVPLSQAQSELETIASRLEKEYPKDNEGRSVRLVPVLETAVGGANQQSQFTLAGGMLMVVVGLVLLIACANLANLLLARAAAREKEMGIRAAMGAARGRLLRQMLTESLILSLAGGTAGLVVAFWARDLLWAHRPPFLNTASVELSLDARVLIFALGISLFTGILFGLVPAIRASDPDLHTTLKLGGRSAAVGWGRGRLRSLLVAGEMALAVLTLIGGGLFLRSLQQAQQIDPGFESKKLFVFFMDIGSQRQTPAQGQQFYLDLVESASSVAGVESAAVSANGPIGGGFARSVFPQGEAPDPNRRGILINTNPVTVGYFKTMGIPLLRGRDFTSFDREGSTPVGIINEAMGARFWPQEDVLGKRFTFFGETVPVEIVGVVPNTVVIQIGEDPQPQVYLPLAQNYSPFIVGYVRTAGDPEPLIEPVRRRVQELNRNLALTNVSAIGEVFDQGLWAPRMGAAMLSVFGLLALGLAALGIYGVMANSVSQRIQEIGIRMALGAERRGVLALVVRQGMTIALAGVGVGILAALAVSRSIASLLFGISATDLATFVGVPLLLTGVALIACYIPARRATRVDPVVALRYE